MSSRTKPPSATAALLAPKALVTSGAQHRVAKMLIQSGSAVAQDDQGNPIYTNERVLRETQETIVRGMRQFLAPMLAAWVERTGANHDMATEQRTRMLREAERMTDAVEVWARDRAIFALGPSPEEAAQILAELEAAEEERVRQIEAVQDEVNKGSEHRAEAAEALDPDRPAPRPAFDALGNPVPQPLVIVE